MIKNKKINKLVKLILVLLSISLTIIVSICLFVIFNGKNSSKTALNFVEYIKEEKYDKAYELLSSFDKKTYSLDSFSDLMSNHYLNKLDVEPNNISILEDSSHIFGFKNYSKIEQCDLEVKSDLVFNTVSNHIYVYLVEEDGESLVKMQYNPDDVYASLCIGKLYGESIDVGLAKSYFNNIENKNRMLPLLAQALIYKLDSNSVEAYNYSSLFLSKLKDNTWNIDNSIKTYIVKYFEYIATSVAYEESEKCIELLSSHSDNDSMETAMLISVEMVDLYDRLLQLHSELFVDSNFIFKSPDVDMNSNSNEDTKDNSQSSHLPKDAIDEKEWSDKFNNDLTDSTHKEID